MIPFFFQQAIDFFDHDIGTKPHTTITYETETRSASKTIGLLNKKFKSNEQIIVINSINIPQFVVHLLGQDGIWAAIGKINKIAKNLLSEDGALFQRIAVISTTGQLKIKPNGMATLIIDVEKQRMQEHPLHEGKLNPTDAPVVPFEDEDVVSINGGEVPVPNYVIHGSNLLRRQYIINVAERVSREALILIQRMNDKENDDNDEAPPKKAKMSKKATVRIEKVVYVGVYHPHVEFQFRSRPEYQQQSEFCHKNRSAE